MPLTARGLKAAKLHLAYLERDGVERDGAPGRLYGADETFTGEEFRAPLDHEQRQFRFIVSPEDGDRLDLKEFAREFMSRVEKDTGRRLIWAAVNHHNTDNPHVHIVVRGVDRDGDEVRIDGRYIGREMRWRAQEVVTRELGPRMEMDLPRDANGGDRAGALLTKSIACWAKHGVADAPHRLLDEGRQVVHLRDVNRRRQRRRRIVERLIDAVGDRDDVAANLPRDVHHRRRLSVARHERRPIDDPLRAPRRCRRYNRRLLPEGDDDVADVVEGGELGGRQDEELLIVLRQTADRRHLVGALQRSAT